MQDLKTIESRFIDYLKDYCGLSSATIANYKIRLNRFINFVWDQKITKFLVEDFVADVRHKKMFFYWTVHETAADWTIYAYIITLRRFLTYLSWHWFIDRDGNIPVISKLSKQKPYNILSKKDVIRIINFPLKYEESRVIWIRNHLIFRYMYETWARLSEALMLRWSHFDEDPLKIKIVGKGKKTRYVYISNNLKNELLALKECDSDIVFRSYWKKKNQPCNDRLASTTVIQRMCQYSKKLWLKVSSHSIRHTFATQSLNKGTPITVVQVMLGHSNIKTTALYLHVCEDDVKRAFENHHMAI